MKSHNRKRIVFPLLLIMVLFAGTFILQVKADSTPPTATSPNTSTMVAGASCKFQVTLHDETALANYTFGCNNTNVWVNETWTTISGLSYIANSTYVLDSTVGVVVQWEYWFSDSSNNTANTGVQTLTTTVGSLDHIVVSPSSATILAGDQETYVATAYDGYSHSLGVVTGLTSWTISSGARGSWSGATYTSSKDGAWTVTATYLGAQASSTLTVTPTVTQQHTNAVFTNVYIALGLVGISLIALACFLIMGSLKSGDASAGAFLVGIIMLISTVVGLVVAFMVAIGFQNSMDTSLVLLRILL
ncbi:MAG: hypothetical protein ABSB71_08100 [Candidatus Bathyarchaeia archaeon]